MLRISNSWLELIGMGRRAVPRNCLPRLFKDYIRVMSFRLSRPRRILMRVSCVRRIEPVGLSWGLRKCLLLSLISGVDGGDLLSESYILPEP